MKLQTKVFGLTAIIFLGHFSFEQYQGHQQVRADVIDDIRREARIVRGMLMSVREVYQKVFLEHDVPINETTLNFLPAHSLSRISANFQKWVDSGLQFNNVSDQPRNPANAADEIEIKAIEFFRNNPGQVERLTPYTNKNGEAFYHFAQPIWITEHCLQCHGSAEEAPASIKAQYSNAFGYQLGELRGLMSIKLPAKAIDQRVSEHFYHNAISHAASFIAAFMLLWWLFQQSILNRITSLKNALLEFSGGAKDIVIDTGGDDELADVASAFDDMVARINDREQLLRINKSLFSAISETNKAIVRMTSPEQLYKNICHIAVDFAGMDSAMVTMMSADGKQLNPVASAGKLANQLLRMQFSLLADEYRNEGTVAIAAREKRTVVANDVTVLQDKINWYNEIAQLNIAAVASFPCFIEGDVVGVFTVLKSTSGFFDAEAVVLFEEMTSEIGFGIGSFQRDQQRQEMHEQLLSTSEQNKKVQNQLRLLLESTGEGIFGADTTGACTFINQAALDMLGLTQEEVIGRRMHELTHHSHADGTRYDAEDCPIYKAFLTGAPIEIADEFFWHKDGRAFPVEYSAYPIREYGVISGVVTVFRDISERYELNKKMDFLSTHDTLTGLYNRTTFKQRLSMAFEEAALGGYQSVLCYLDIDRFMIINDSYGYLAGDATLQLFSGLILSQIRKTDILSRLTADEFGLYLHDCSLAQAEALCRKICKAVEDFEFTWLNKKLPITVSIGITQLTHENHSVDNVLNAAHSACYVAKEKGRNQIYVQNGNGDEVAKRTQQIEWISNIQSAIEEDRMRLHFQTIQPTRNGMEDGRHFEILLRMLGPDGKNIPPDTFIPIAEKFDMMPTIDRWVISTTLQWLHNNPAKAEEIHLCSINLSGHSLGDESMLDFIQNEFTRKKVSPQKICFEVTETAAINSLEQAIHFMRDVKQLGCQFALDDFGAGMSSFAYLKNMPVDYLKIDGSFIKDMLDDPINRAMVVSINEIGQVMGLKTIAEYVENDQIKQALVEIGVDYLQGYGIARPAPLCDR